LELNNQDNVCGLSGQQSKTTKRFRPHVSLSGLMCTTALIVTGTTVIAQDAPEWDTEPFLVTTTPVASNISQIDGGTLYTNSLRIDSVGTLAIVNGVTQNDVTSAVQDSEGGSNSLNISTTSNPDDTPNYVFVSQLGDVTQTLTINGAANKVYLVDFGGKSESTNDNIFLSGDKNIMTLTTTALSAAHTLMDVDVEGEYSTIYISNDEFSKLILWLSGFSDDVSVVQSNDGVTEQYSASMSLFNEADVNISGSSVGNIVSITQTGTNNVLDFDLSGDDNNINVNQVNNGEAKNDLTVDLTDDSVDLEINASGAGLNAFTVNGSGNILTISSDSLGTGLSSNDAQANITVLGMNNVVNALDYTDVSISLGVTGNLVDGNHVSTTGNANVAIFSDFNVIELMNSYSANPDFKPNIVIGEIDDFGSNNSVMANIDSPFGVSRTFNLTIDGTGNEYDLDTFDLVDVNVTIDGSTNRVRGNNSVIGSDLTLDLTGDSNDVYFNNLSSFDNQAALGIFVTGNNNVLNLQSGADEVYSSDFIITGDGNTFGYDLLAGVNHTTVGSNFGATFTTAETAGGRAYYNVLMDQFGSGFTKFRTGGSSIVITGDCAYAEDANGDGACL
jgi:hypothetical protein